MTIAVAVIVVAGVVYLHPFRTASSHRVLPGAPASPTPEQLDTHVSATYDFVTPALGWAVVTENLDTSPRFWVFRTTDGAKHWKQQLAGRCAALGTSDLRMFDRTRGEFDLCDPLLAYRTANGGATWTPVALPSSEIAYMTFGDYQHGWYLTWSLGSPGPGVPAVEKITRFLKTADGGVTWTTLPQPPLPSFTSKGNPFNLQFRGALTGWMGTYSNAPVVYSTVDGGLTWKELVLPSVLLQPGKGGFIGTEIKLLPGSSVLASTSDAFGDVYGFTTDDGGLIWHRIQPPPGNTTFDDYAFVDATHWWALRNSTLYKSSDGGQTWKMTDLLFDQWDYLPHPLDANRAWAELTPGAGLISPPNVQGGSFYIPGGGLAMTSDGGRHWTYVSVPQPQLS